MESVSLCGQNLADECKHRVVMPDEAFFQQYPKLLGHLGKLLYKFWDVWGIFGTVHDFHHSVFFSTKNFVFQTQPKYIPNMTLAEKNLGNSAHASVVSECKTSDQKSESS